MDQRDILAVGGALIVVLVIALVVKPMFFENISPLSNESGSNEKFAVSTSTTPNLNPQRTEEKEPPHPSSWDGTVIILSFNETTGMEGMYKDTSSNSTMSPINGSPAQIPVRYLVQTLDDRIEGSVLDTKMDIQEGAQKISIMNNSQRSNSTLIFYKTYLLRYTPVTFMVDVAPTPLNLTIKITPTTLHPYYKNNPFYCFLSITIQDRMTNEVIAQEGYGRGYGMKNEKSIIIFRPGSYQVYLKGNMVQVELFAFRET